MQEGVVKLLQKKIDVLQWSSEDVTEWMKVSCAHILIETPGLLATLKKLDGYSLLQLSGPETDDDT